MIGVTANNHRPPNSVIAYAKELLAAIKAALSETLAYRRRMAELQDLDERELTDIGIGRSDFDAIARGIYQHPPRRSRLAKTWRPILPVRSR